MTDGDQRSIDSAAEPAVPNAHLILWICAVLLLLCAVGASHYLRGPRLKPRVTSWKIAKHELRVRVALVNTSRHPLYYAHHPFPVQFLIAGTWRDAEVLNAYRSTRLEPGAELFAEVLVAEPDRPPAQFQVGTDFEVHRTLPRWLMRLESGIWGKPIHLLLGPILRRLEQPKPVPCAWSDAVSMKGHPWE